ncbi:MAG TPA: hypothetical protein P5300_03310 [Acidobacteriota bacterium]|nr:hypothetical protein [Acidobacteriota bacterium]
MNEVTHMNARGEWIRWLLAWLLATGSVGSTCGQEPVSGVGAETDTERLTALSVNVEFRNDLRIFTVMTAVTAAGFAAGRDSLRDSRVLPVVRETLSQLDWGVLETVRLGFRSYRFPDVVEQYTAFISLALLLEDPPSLRLRQDAPVIPDDVKPLLGFERYLGEFYDKAGVGELWERVRPYYEEELRSYHPVMARAVQEVQSFARTPGRVAMDRTLVVISDLLGLRNVVHARNIEKTYVIVLGPVSDPMQNLQALEHEYLHFLLDPVLEKHGGVLLKHRDLLELAEKQPDLSASFRDQFLLLVGESLVESVLLRIHPPEDERAETVKLFRKGYVLTPFFLRRLDGYLQQSELRLPEFLESVCQALDRKEVEKDAELIAKWEEESRVAAEQAKSAEHERRRSVELRQKQTELLNRAADSLSRGDFSEARAVLEEILTATPEEPTALFYLAQIEAQSGNHAAAARRYEHLAGREDAPDWVRGWSFVRWGRFLASQGMFAEAREKFETVLQMGGDLQGATQAAKESLAQLAAVDGR